MQQEARNSAIGADENKPRRVGEINNVVIMGIKFYKMPQTLTLNFICYHILFSAVYLMLFFIMLVTHSTKSMSI